MSDANTSSNAVEPSIQPSSGSRRPLWLNPFQIALAYLVYWQIVIRLRSDSLFVIILSSMVSLGLMIWLAASLGRTLQSGKALFICTLTAAALIVPIQIMLVLRYPLVPWIYLLLIPGMQGVMLILFASCLGVALSKLVRAANMIPPIAVVLALVDIYTVLLGGPVKQVMQSETPVAQNIVKAFTAPVAVPEQVSARPFAPIVGFADFLFTAFFIAAICRFVTARSPYARTVITLVTALCLYMCIVLYFDLSLPALVPMSLVMLTLHWKNFQYSRSEVFALIYAAMIIFLVVGLFWFLGRSREPEAPPRSSRLSLYQQIAV
jgi:hypothetical protein